MDLRDLSDSVCEEGESNENGSDEPGKAPRVPAESRAGETLRDEVGGCQDMVRHRRSPERPSPPG
jgi:hypothetical protein